MELERQLKRREKGINLIRVTGLIRSSKTVYCKVSRRAILPADSTK